MSEQSQVHQPPPTTTPLPPSTASANPGISAADAHAADRPRPRPRIAIQYCTQCKWMLRAAYFAQELLSTFSTDLEEVSLRPSTGGIFTVTIYHHPDTSTSTTSSASGPGSGEKSSEIATQLWDRKRDGGFPEVKVLKSLVRNVVDPGRSLGHTDRALKGHASTSTPAATSATAGTGSGSSSTATSVQTAGDGQSQGQGQGPKECEDCR